MNRHFLLSALILLFSGLINAQGYQVQSKYFVYLQTEPAQPFYIKINGQQINANASGYLILPQLKDGDYKLVVGFPQTQTPEQSFNFKIDSKDKGYLIKDYGADGWGLFDLQTMAVQKPLSADDIAKAQQEADKKENDRKAAILARRKQQEEERQKAEREEEARLLQQQKEQEALTAASIDTTTNKQVTAAEKTNNDVSDFTKVLSQAAKDPTLLEKPKEPPVEEKPVKKEDKAVVNNVEVSTENKAANNYNSVQNRSDNGNSNSTLISQTKADDGVTLVYDNRDETGQVDPITIFIAAPQQAQQQKGETAPTANENKNEPDLEKENALSENSGDSKFVVEEKPAIQQEGQESKPLVKITNAACKSVASEDDFLKLRRSMASEANDDNMIAQAEKAFKSKCYTTAQIKYLSSMFLSNAGKYNFYKSAYDHTADRENFATLADEIRDQGYKDKFNKLLQ